MVLSRSMGNPFYDAYPGLGGMKGGPLVTPPYRLPQDMAGPMPPVGMPPMSEEEAMKSEEGYYGPPPKRQGRRGKGRRRPVP